MKRRLMFIFIVLVLSFVVNASTIDDMFRVEVNSTNNTFYVLANDVGETLVDAVSDPSNGDTSRPANLTFVYYTPDTNFAGMDSFVYTTSNNVNGTVDVIVNTAPVAVDDNSSVSEDASVNISVLTNDYDLNGDNISLVEVGSAVNGMTVIVNDIVTYTPNENFFGTDTFTYVVSDIYGENNTGSVTVTVSGTADDPIANNDTFYLDEDSSLTFDFRLNDTDPDGDSISISFNTPLENLSGSLTLNANLTYTYIPNSDFFGTDSFTYTINDGTGRTSGATVDLIINNVNDVPTANNDYVGGFEDVLLIIDVLNNDTDIDPDTLIVFNVTYAGNGTVTVVNNTLQYLSNANYNGGDSFSYTLSDGNGGFDSATVTVELAAVDDVPIATNDSTSVLEDSSVEVSVLDNDQEVDGEGLSVVSYANGTNGIVTMINSSLLKYTPTEDFFGVDNFTYVVSDTSGNSVTGYVFVSVNNTQDAPTANNDSASGAEDVAVTINVLGNDVDIDDDNISVVGFTQGISGTVSLNANGTLNYLPNADFNGADTFTYTIQDTNSANSTATVSMSISAVNDAPVMSNLSLSLDEDGNVIADVVGNSTDIDGDILSLISYTNGTFGTVVNIGGVLTYTPNTNYFGADSFSYIVTDGIVNVSGSVNLNISSVNDAPVASNDSSSVVEINAITFLVLSNDVDTEGDSLSVVSTTNGSNGTVVNNGANVTYTADSSFIGIDSFSYVITDGNGGTSTGYVSVNVVESDLSFPTLATFSPSKEVVDRDFNVTITVADNIALSSVNLTINLGNSSWGPFALTNINGTDDYYYTVSSSLLSSAGNYTFNVSAVDTSLEGPNVASLTSTIAVINSSLEVLNITSDDITEAVTTSSFSVTASAEIPSMFTLRYGTDASNLTSSLVSSSYTFDYTFDVTGLPSGTTYYYEVVAVGYNGLQNSTLPGQSVATASPASSGSSGSGGGSSSRRRTVVTTPVPITEVASVTSSNSDDSGSTSGNNAPVIESVDTIDTNGVSGSTDQEVTGESNLLTGAAVGGTQIFDVSIWYWLPLLIALMGLALWLVLRKKSKNNV